MERSLARAEEVSHPPTLAYALIMAATAKLFLGESDEAEHGFSLDTTQGAVVQSCATLQRGELQAGLVTIVEALSAYRATGARLHLPFFLAFLAEGYLRAGSIADGVRVAEEALRLTATNLDVFWEAELHRIKGDLLLKQSSSSPRPVTNKSKTSRGKSAGTAPHSLTANPQAEAEVCFRQAIEVARSQGAKSLELRATISLARLWQNQGKLHAARTTLAEIYGWFTEGLDTQDLQDAKTLLMDLA
jgi:predicted ATPase